MVDKLGSYLLSSLQDQLEDSPEVNAAAKVEKEDQVTEMVEILKRELKRGLKDALDTEEFEPQERDPRLHPQNWEEWLNSYFLRGEDGFGLTVRDYLNTAKITEEGRWTDAHINLALQYLRIQYKPEQGGITILSTAHVSELFRYYSGLKGLEDKSNVQALANLRAAHSKGCGQLHEKIATNNNWVVIPLNQGMDEESSSGRHWTFMLVNLRNRGAWMIDGDVRYVQLRGDWRPAGPSSTTKIGAKIIVALESFLNLPHPGTFKPKMQRFVPHQDDNNLANGPDRNPFDLTADGPYLLHVLGYLLGGFRGYYEVENFTYEEWEERNKAIAFNSKTARNALQRELFSKRKSQDLSGNFDAPFNLTNEVLMMMSMDGVSSIAEELTRRHRGSPDRGRNNRGNNGGHPRDGDDDDENDDHHHNTPGGLSSPVIIEDDSATGGSTTLKRKLPEHPDSASHVSKKAKPGPGDNGGKTRGMDIDKPTSTAPSGANKTSPKGTEKEPPKPNTGSASPKPNTGNAPPKTNPKTNTAPGTGKAPPKANTGKVIQTQPQEPQYLERIDFLQFANAKGKPPAELEPYIARLLEAMPELRDRIYSDDENTLVLTKPDKQKIIKKEVKESPTAILYLQQAFDGGFQGVLARGPRTGSKTKPTISQVERDWARLAFPTGTKLDALTREYKFGALWGKLYTLVDAKSETMRQEFRDSPEVPDLRSPEDKEALPRAELEDTPPKRTKK